MSEVLAALIVAVMSGCILWLWAAAASGKLEAWDGPFYFSRVVPALGVVSGLCGFIAPRHAWRWPAIIYASQFMLMLARAEPPVGPLAPLGIHHDGGTCDAERASCLHRRSRTQGLEQALSDRGLMRYVAHNLLESMPGTLH